MDDTTLSKFVYPGTRPVTDVDAPAQDPRLEAFEALRYHIPLYTILRTAQAIRTFKRRILTHCLYQVIH
jgi:hypothetical protein